MTRCKNYDHCTNCYEGNQTCEDDNLARGYCGIRKDEVAPLKKENHLERKTDSLVQGH